ncbi:putative ribonuclease H-like domain-containing protein [Tanacetum coccineum]
MDEFCREKGIKREYSVARTPQQNGVAERKNRTLIEAARTMLADSKLPTTFWGQKLFSTCLLCQDGNHDDSSFQDDGIDDHQVNTASPQVNTGSSDLVLLIMMLFLLHSEGLIGTKSYLEDSQRRIKEQGYWYKWVLQKQEDERGTVLARCVVAIRIFLAYASFMGFTVYQMDVKSAFLYGQIEEEVYVCQPPGFEDPDHPDKVYKVVKSLYGLHKHLIYVDDIIFGSTKKELCEEFEKLMKDKFQMSSMGELTFFLGLQVQQKQKGIFISQVKYVLEILKVIYTDVKSAYNPIDFGKTYLVKSHMLMMLMTSL